MHDADGALKHAQWCLRMNMAHHNSIEIMSSCVFGKTPNNPATQTSAIAWGRGLPLMLEWVLCPFLAEINDVVGKLDVRALELFLFYYHILASL